MKRRHKAFLFVLAAALRVLAVSAQTAGNDATRDAACKPYASLRVEDAARPTPQEARLAGKSCSAFQLYYEDNSPDHFRKARVCGQARLGFVRGEPAPGEDYQGGLRDEDALVLAMLFANGEGGPRDAVAAKALVCGYGFASQQADPTQLPALLQTIDDGKPFLLCGRHTADEGSEGPQGRSIWYACATLRERRNEEDIAREQGALNRAAPAHLRTALLKLEHAWAQVALEEWATFSAECSGGTGCGVYDAEHRGNMQRAWLAKLKSARSGTPPADLPQAGKLPSLDTELNELYQERLKLNSSDAPPPEKGIRSLADQTRETERAWIAYRDAWVSYAAQRWPAVPADHWRAWITAEWIDVLQSH